jgi:glutamate--cysteine ligase
VYAGPHIIALEGERTAHISLEPGGQLELSGAVHRRLVDLREEMAEWTTRLQEHSEPLGILWLGLGLQPFTSLSGIEWVPKPRYRIMSARLGATGTLGHVMMKQTAGVQVNLDYSDEQDGMDKFRVASALSSLVTALFANSPLAEGRANGFMSYRSWVWQHTDPARCGLLPFAFRRESKFGDYLDYALDVPMMFILRHGTFIDMNGMPFRDFLRSGAGEHRPTLEDFQLHLTTLFPEVRLKRYLELRGGDSGDPRLALAQVALWKGILYDSAARRAAWDLVVGMDWEARREFHTAAARDGSDARLGTRTAREAGLDLSRIAREGLERQGEPVDLLVPLEELLRDHRACPAKTLMDRWNGEWRSDPRRLLQHCSRLTLKPSPSSGEDLGEDY